MNQPNAILEGIATMVLEDDDEEFEILLEAHCDWIRGARQRARRHNN